jgi:hypothetical protein
MPLIKTVLSSAIKAAFTKQADKKSEGDSPETAIQELSDDIATAIDAYIKSALVTVTGVSPSGAVTGTGVIS